MVLYRDVSLSGLFVEMRVFLVLFSLLYVGLVLFIIRLKYVPVAAGRWSSPVGR